MQKVLVIHDFMLKDSNLKGSRLLVYAFIYSFSQIPDSKYCVKWNNAIKFLGISKSSYFDSILWLITNGYINQNDLSVIPEYPLSVIHDNVNSKKYNELTNEEFRRITLNWVKK